MALLPWRVRPDLRLPDLAFRGVDEACAPAQLIHRGKFKSLDEQQRRWLKRRQAIEPAIGHTKSDNRMDRCWFGGSSGDALRAVLCAAGFNIRWLPRAIAAKGLAALLLAFSQLALYAACICNVLQIAHPGVGPRDQRTASRRCQIVPAIAAERV